MLDVHTGLGPSGTDTLALLSDSNQADFAEYIDKVFPLEKDGDRIVGGDKASDKEGSAMSGYELTIGTMKSFCEKWAAPNKSKKEAICLTQEFGTVSVVEVGKAQIEENWAFHHGTERDKALYGQRLKGVFYVETEEWMRNVAHRGITLWLQAFHEI